MSLRTSLLLTWAVELSEEAALRSPLKTEVENKGLFTVAEDLIKNYPGLAVALSDEALTPGQAQRVFVYLKNYSLDLEEVAGPAEDLSKIFSALPQVTVEELTGYKHLGEALDLSLALLKPWLIPLGD